MRMRTILMVSLFLSNYRILKSIGPEVFTCYLNHFVMFCKGVPVDVSKGVLLLSAECKSIKFAYSYNITQVFASRDLKQPVRLCLFPAALKQPVRLSGWWQIDDLNYNEI